MALLEAIEWYNSYKSHLDELRDLIGKENGLEVKDEDLAPMLKEFIATKNEALKRVREYELIPLAVLKRAPSEVGYIIENWTSRDENSPFTIAEIEDMITKVARGSRMLAIKDA